MTKTWTAMMTRARIHLSPGIEALCFALGFFGKEKGTLFLEGWGMVLRGHYYCQDCLSARRDTLCGRLAKVLSCIHDFRWRSMLDLYCSLATHTYSCLSSEHPILHLSPSATNNDPASWCLIVLSLPHEDPGRRRRQQTSAESLEKVESEMTEATRALQQHPGMPSDLPVP
jgi:hypothetical protein